FSGSNVTLSSVGFPSGVAAFGALASERTIASATPESKKRVDFCRIKVPFAKRDAAAIASVPFRLIQRQNGFFGTGPQENSRGAGAISLRAGCRNRSLP